VYVCWTDGTTVTSRGRVGLRKRVLIFFPLPQTVEAWEREVRGQMHRRLDANKTGARSNGDLDRRPRLASAGKGK
jgi:hypothetical protein